MLAIQVSTNSGEVHPGSITLAMQSVKVASDVLKALGQADRSLETAEFKLQMADLAGALADVKIQFADLREYVQELEAKSTLHETIKFDPHANVFRDDDRLPICPKCFTVDERVCYMQDRDDDHWLHCLSCEKTVEKPGPRT